MLKLHSGGQNGADQGGLKAAAGFGFETGGWIPKGWLTENGPNPSLKMFGLKEHSSNKYPPRTYANVKDADGTIRFAANFNSPGEKCTLKAIYQYKKPHIDVDLNNPIPPIEVAEWIKNNKISVLNVAGNRESTNPGIEEFVIKYLYKVFTILNYKPKEEYGSKGKADQNM